MRSGGAWVFDPNRVGEIEGFGSVGLSKRLDTLRNEHKEMNAQCLGDISGPMTEAKLMTET